MQSDLAAQTAHAFARMPIGRIGWHEVECGQASVRGTRPNRMKSALLKSGFAKGDAEFSTSSSGTSGEPAGRMRW